MSIKPLTRKQVLHRATLLNFLVLPLIVAGCSQPVKVIDYPPLDWSINAQRLQETGCTENMQVSCPELVALGCDEINSPSFYQGGLQPAYPVLECIHDNGEPPNPEVFKQVPGMDSRYRSFALYQDEQFRLLIKRSEFKSIFAPIESTDEAVSYATAMTGLQARFDIDPNADIEYLVDGIAETHAEETPDGYLVYLFDWSHQMGCATHPFYAVKVLVTREGDITEVDRQEIYKSYACFDFESLRLEEN